MRQSSLVTQDMRSAVLRATRAFHRPRVMPKIQKKALQALVKLAVQQGDAEGGRLYIIVYGFLFRVADDLFVMQADGKCGLLESSTVWYSSIQEKKHSVIV